VLDAMAAWAVAQLDDGDAVLIAADLRVGVRQVEKWRKA
jgi:hypothetical protein